jgi:nucleoside-diphosphate-sugar epimerase
MKKILVVGGAGYVGSALIPALLERSYKVEVVDLFWFGDHLPKVRKYKIDSLDLTKEDLKTYDQVIFLAGLSSDPMAEFSPSLNFIHNGAAPAHLAYIAKQAGVKRFIYAGSCSVYGYAQDKLYDENSPVISNYPYGISKLQGEIAMLKLQDESFSTISLRQGTISGYSPRMRLDLIVNTMFKTAMQEGKIRVNNSSIWRPIISIKDIVTAYIRTIECDKSISGVFNISYNNYTVGAVADWVKKSLKKKVILEINDVKDYRNYKVNTEKAKNILGFEPSNNVSDMVEDLINNYDKFRDLDNDNYYNIKVFKKNFDKIK